MGEDLTRAGLRAAIEEPREFQEAVPAPVPEVDVERLRRAAKSMRALWHTDVLELCDAFEAERAARVAAEAERDRWKRRWQHAADLLVAEQDERERVIDEAAEVTDSTKLRAAGERLRANDEQLERPTEATP